MSLGHTVKKHWKWIAHGLVAFGAITLAYFISAKISSSTILSLVDKLISVSSIIFAIMGVWFSVSKVEIEQKVKEYSTEGNSTDAENAIKRAYFLVIPMTASAFALLFSLLFYLGYYILPLFDLSSGFVAFVKGTTLAFTVFFYIIIAFNTAPLFLSGGLFILDLLSVRNKKIQKISTFGQEIEDDN